MSPGGVPRYPRPGALLVLLVLSVALALVLLWAVRRAWGANSIQVENSQMFQPMDVIFTGANGKELARIKPDGRVEFGPDYTPEETARVFWQALAGAAPARVRRGCFARLRRERAMMARDELRMPRLQVATCAGLGCAHFPDCDTRSAPWCHRHGLKVPCWECAR